jgi:gliding motility-associated-like protein
MGNNPDGDNNMICNEASDNVPTLVVLPIELTLFVPQGFSPDNDGINDVFVIQGLPRDGKSAITIYNRWGNKVYKSENYLDGNPWDGSANVGGTLGQGKLPQGTYYYVLEIEGSKNKTLTGFIILQY